MGCHFAIVYMIPVVLHCRFMRLRWLCIVQSWGTPRKGSGEIDFEPIEASGSLGNVADVSRSFRMGETGSHQPLYYKNRKLGYGSGGFGSPVSNLLLSFYSILTGILYLI